MQPPRTAGALYALDGGHVRRGTPKRHDGARPTAAQSLMEWPAPPSGVVGSPAVQKEELKMVLTAISVLGVDLGKNVCSVVGLDATGAVVMRRKMRRETLIGFAEKLPACVVGMEACCGAHHLGRSSGSPRSHGALDVSRVCATLGQGAEERRSGRGGDRRGGDPTDDALRRLQERGAARHADAPPGVRSGWWARRTALINQLRAILLERGPSRLRARANSSSCCLLLVDKQGGDAALSPAHAPLLVADAARPVGRTDRRIAAFDAEFVAMGPAATPTLRRLTTIPGFGVLNGQRR